QHLLLAARKVGAAVVAPFLEPREHFVDPLKWPALRCRQACDDEVFLHIEAAENPPLLMDQLHAGLSDRVALAACQIDAVELYGTRSWRHHAHQAFQGCALASAVAAE